MNDFGTTLILCINTISLISQYQILDWQRIAFATSAIRHLTNVGVVDTEKEDKYGRGVFRPKSEDTPLILSGLALQRIYAPITISSDHHAICFLSFSPPFESVRSNLPEEDRNSSVGSRVSSLGGSSAAFKQKKALTDKFRRSNVRVGVIDENPVAESAHKMEAQSALTTPSMSSVDFAESQQNSVSLMGQLNCCRVKNISDVTCCVPNNEMGGSSSIYQPFASSPTNQLPRYDLCPVEERAAQVSWSKSPPATSTSSMPAPNLSGIQIKPSKISNHASRHRRQRRTQTIDY